MEEDAPQVETTNQPVSDIREDALCLVGVDNLSSSQLKKYLDFYLKDNVAIVEQRINGYHLEWVNDSTVVIVFADAESCSKSLVLLSESYDDTINLASTELRKAKTFDFSGGLSKTTDQDTNEPESSSLELLLRKAFNADKKLKNAKDFSRYYLLNGEPDYSDRYHRNDTGSTFSSSRKRRGGYKGSSRVAKQDLFPNKLREKRELFPEKASRVKQELFPNKVSTNRDRSPPRSRNRSPSRLQDLSNRIGRF